MLNRTAATLAFLKMHGAPPPAEELKAFCARLNEIQAAGGRIKLVQVYTVAREPSERWVAVLSDGEVPGQPIVRVRVAFGWLRELLCPFRQAIDPLT